MSMVMFATICDPCGKRSEEYSAFPSCRTCMEDVCPDCSTNIDDEHKRADCLRCLETPERGDLCQRCWPTTSVLSETKSYEEQS